MQTKEKPMQSILRYPGGKTRAVSAILEHIPEGITELCSPFFGGGSVEFALASKGVRVHGYDVFTPLTDFWQEIFENPERLANEVQAYYPLSLGAFYNLQKEQETLPTRLERGAAFYVLNRCSFSGATLSGGMSPGHPRFTPSAIQRVRDFRVWGLTVENADFTDALRRHPNTFLYLDPPYLIKSMLYGKKGDAHRGFDHMSLHSLLANRGQWVMSYNDCPEIRELYAGSEIIPLSWKYGMSKDKDSKEILILSK